MNAIDTRLTAGLEYLARHGLNLVAILDCDHLQGLLPPAVAHYPRLLLIGNAGRDFWTAFVASGGTGDNPVDAFSLRTARRFIRDYLGDPPTRLLYPGDEPVPLQRLGTAADWHHDSPLGLGVHPRYGPWFSYRVAIAVDAALPTTAAPRTAGPCASCVDKPCIHACPGHAVAKDRPFDTTACVGHRLRAGSQCALSCPSRMACPAGSEYRYDRAQIAYHYGHSLFVLRHCRTGNNVDHG